MKTEVKTNDKFWNQDGRIWKYNESCLKIFYIIWFVTDTILYVIGVDIDDL